MEEDEDVNDHPDRFVVDCTYVTFIITFMKLSSLISGGCILHTQHSRSKMFYNLYKHIEKMTVACTMHPFYNL